MRVRKPAVAGSFYPSSESKLKEMVAKLVEAGLQKEKVLGVVSPHAGYIYSGKGAGILFSSIEIPDDVVILGVNHRGLGPEQAIYGDGIWELPSGRVSINKELSDEIMSHSRALVDDESAHRYEHSLEVQIPFIQYFNPDFRLVPISLGRLSLRECLELGDAIAKALQAYQKPCLIVASSDMTHFESQSQAKKKDELAINKILALDEEGLYRTVEENNISMCGVIPATVMLRACKKLGAKSAKLVDYRSSGEVTGDYNEVVAYASILVK